MCTPSDVENPWRSVSSRSSTIFSSRKEQLSQVDPPPAPAPVMHDPPSGLPLASTGVSASMPFGLAGSLRTTGLKLTLTSWSAKSWALRKSSRPEKLSAELSSKLPPIEIRVRADDAADVLDDAVERALAAAKRTHAVVRVLVAVERDLGAAQPVRQQPIDDLGRQQQAVGDDAHRLLHAARLRRAPRALGHVVHHRQIQERLAAEERDDERLGLQAVELALDPGRDARGGLERHLLGELVEVFAIALVAVPAGEVALQRRQQRDVELRRCCA